MSAIAGGDGVSSRYSCSSGTINNGSNGSSTPEASCSHDMAGAYALLSAASRWTETPRRLRGRCTPVHAGAYSSRSTALARWSCEDATGDHGHFRRRGDVVDHCAYGVATPVIGRGGLH